MTRRGFLRDTGVVASLVAGCWRAGGNPARHIILYLIDTLRADRMALYGWEKPTTPFLQELAGESVVFANAESPAPWTVPSVASVFSGRLPHQHQVLATGSADINPDCALLAEEVKRLGYKTLHLTKNPYSKQYGLARGFDSILKGSATLDEMTLRIGATERSFSFIHTIEPHDPYAPSDERLSAFGKVPEKTKKRVNELLKWNRLLAQREIFEKSDLDADGYMKEQRRVADDLGAMLPEVERLYAGEVRSADSAVNRFVTALKKDGTWDNTLFILISDHGEELYDRGYWQHDQSVYQELLHVPLLVKFPGQEFGGKRVEATVSLLDVGPTVLEILGANAIPDAWEGKSLMSLISSESDEAMGKIRLVAERINVSTRNLAYEPDPGNINCVLRKGPWKCVCNIERDTYELYQDPKDAQDLSVTEPVLLERFQEFARIHLHSVDWEAILREQAQCLGPRALKNEDRQALEGLGYL